MRSPSQVRRPLRLNIAAVLLGLFMLVGVGLLLLVLWTMTMPALGVSPLSVTGLALTAGSLLWSGVLVYGLLAGRSWARFAVSVTMPLFLPVFAFGAWLETHYLAEQIQQNADMNGPVDLIRVLEIVLFITGTPLALLPPLVLIGPDVTAYLRRHRLPAPSATTYQQ